jgi:hypothetical protein
MPQINLVSGRNNTYTFGAGTANEFRFWPYADGSQLHLLRRALFIIEHNIYKKNNACNKYFGTLSPAAASRSFDKVWEDNTIWISYEPRTGLGWDGATDSGQKEVTLGEDAFTHDGGNRWYVAAVLVHELAHCAGAGGAPSKAASTALKFCGLANLYDGAVGARVVQSDQRMA